MVITPKQPDVYVHRSLSVKRVRDINTSNVLLLKYSYFYNLNCPDRKYSNSTTGKIIRS